MTICSNLAVALGSNVASSAGGPAETLQEAIGLLRVDSLEILSISPFYVTPAMPLGSGPDFVNAVLTARTTLTPDAVLDVLHAVEDKLDRTRAARWAARTIDLDLLYYGHHICPNETVFEYWKGLSPEDQMTFAPEKLILPHPRLQDRAFVLVPLADVSPNWRHPVLEKTVLELRNALPEADLAQIKRI